MGIEKTFLGKFGGIFGAGGERALMVESLYACASLATCCHEDFGLALGDMASWVGRLWVKSLQVGHGCGFDYG